MTAYLVMACANLLLILIVLAHSRERTALIFVAFCLALAGWELELFFLRSIFELERLKPLFHTFRIGLFFIGPLLLLFVVTITKTKIDSALKVVLVVAFLTSVTLSVLNNTIFPSKMIWLGDKYSPEFDALTIVNYVNTFSLNAVTVYVAIRAFLIAPVRSKFRMKWIMIASIVGVIFGVFQAFFPRLYLGIIGCTLFLYFISYAVVRYRLVTAVALPLVGFFVLFDWLFGLLGLKGQGYIVAQIVVVLGLIEIHPFLVKRLKRIREKYSTAGTYNFIQVKTTLSEQLRTANSADMFTQVCDKIFKTHIQVKSYSIHLSGEYFIEGQPGCYYTFNPLGKLTTAALGNQLSSLTNSKLLGSVNQEGHAIFCEKTDTKYDDQLIAHQASAAIPILLDGKMAGVILLCEPMSGELFSHDDVKLMDWFGGEIGYILKNLIAYMEQEAALRLAIWPAN